MLLVPESDKQREVVEAFRAWEIGPPEYARLLDPFEYTASANYVVPMLLHLALRRGNEIVDSVPRYSSLDHAVNFQTLLAAVERFDGFAVPYLEWARAADPFAEELLSYEYNKIVRRHTIASFDTGLWSLVSDADGLRVNLAPSMRRSALQLVAHAAEFEGQPEELQAHLMKGAHGDAVDLALVSGNVALQLFAEACPGAWARLWREIPFSLNTLPALRAFAISLERTHGRWFDQSEMWDLWTAFTESRQLAAGEREEFEAALDFYTLPPARAREWGLQVPFLKLGEALALWPFAFHVLLPELGMLSLLTRRYESLWSRTLGGELDRAADWLAQRVRSERVVAAARRRKQSVGEADLVIYDRETAHVVVLELKTTYDKFRSHVQLRNFTEQRVNFPKAIGQARQAAAAIADGRWTMHDIFADATLPPPSAVTPGVLTWWDTFNPTLGDPEPIMACNFATFSFMVRRARGDLRAAARAIEELAAIYCVGSLVPGSWTIGGEPWPVRREVQTDLLPSDDELPQVSPLTRELLDELPRCPPDWRESWPAREPEPFAYDLA